ncbi:MAG: hypothetical protein M1820_003699 [Bogoriella megaspora]|nr:MAG: hypothetical protein M1820_003699 [Bogoriella megaspora]
MAHPPQQQAPAAPQQGSQGSGLFGQMASTAAGVAVGSSIGHAIGGFFGGGSSSQAPAEQQQAQAPASYDNNAGQYAYTQETPSACENQVRSFRTCMDEQQGNMSVCGWYLDQLKACQAQARQY